MGILGKLFGSDKVIDAGISAIDKVFYTKEEKAEDRLKRIGAKLKYLSAYEAFKIAQRIIALVIGIPFALIHLIGCIFWFVLIGFAVSSGVPIVAESPSAYEFGVAQLLKLADMNNRTLGEPFAWIVIFYYGGGAAEGMVSKFMSSRRAKK